MSKLTRPVPLARWKYHAGHSMLASVVAFVALAFGATLFWATILGTLIWPLLHESLEGLFYGPAPLGDHVSDFIQHQPLWVVYFLGVGDAAIALLAAAVIGVLYWVTLDWSRP